jgi:spore coat-associated protein N
MKINRRVVGSIATIGVAATILIGATFAFFSNSGTSSDNIFSAGTLDLKLTDSNEIAQDNVTASFGGSNLAPGDCVPSASGSATLKVKNTGTVAGNHIDFAFSNNNATMSAQLRVDLLTYDGGDLLAGLANSNGTSFKDLGDLQVGGINNQPLTDLNTDHTLAMRVCLDSSTDNAFQGQSDTLTVTAGLKQGPHSGGD